MCDGMSWLAQAESNWFGVHFTRLSFFFSSKPFFSQVLRVFDGFGWLDLDAVVGSGSVLRLLIFGNLALF